MQLTRSNIRDVWCGTLNSKIKNVEVKIDLYGLRKGLKALKFEACSKLRHKAKSIIHGPSIVRSNPQENKRTANSALQDSDNTDHRTHDDGRRKSEQPESGHANSRRGVRGGRGGLGRGSRNTRTGCGAGNRASGRSGCRLSIILSAANRIMQGRPHTFGYKSVLLYVVQELVAGITGAPPGGTWLSPKQTENSLGL